MKWIKRTHLTTLKTIDNMETKLSDITYWFFEIAIVYFYEKIILNFLTGVVYFLNVLMYLPIFIIFLFPSLFVELVIYSRKTRVEKPRRTNEVEYDLINKGK